MLTLRIGKSLAWGRRTGKRLDFFWNPTCNCSFCHCQRPGWGTWKWRAHLRCEALMPFTGKPGRDLHGSAFKVKSLTLKRHLPMPLLCAPRTPVIPRVCAGALGAPGLSLHKVSSSPQKDAEKRLRRTEPMSNKPCGVVHSQKVVHSPQSTGKSSWQKDLSHKESEEKGEDRVTRTRLKWGSIMRQRRPLMRDVNAMDGAVSQAQSSRTFPRLICHSCVLGREEEIFCNMMRAGKRMSLS